jgi:hypothetical protein
MFLANTFNTGTNCKSDSFPIQYGLYFRKDKNVKNDSIIFHKGIYSWDDQMYSLRALIESQGYDTSIETLIMFFKKAYNNIISVRKEGISYYDYLEDNKKIYEDFRIEYSYTTLEDDFKFVMRGTDITEFRKILNCLFMTMEGVDKYIDDKGEVGRLVYNISELEEELGGRSKLIDLVIEGVKPFIKDLSKEDVEAMPWLTLEDQPMELTELPYYYL